MENKIDIPIFDLNQAKKILAVQPHYDDNDIAAGGTLYTLAENGAQITYLTVTDDRAGIIDLDLSKEKALQELLSNQSRAAEIIGVEEQIRLGFPDAHSYDYFHLRDQIINLIRSEQPDLIMTVDPWMPYEAHNDHILTGKAVAEAAILYQLPVLGTFDESKMMLHYELQAVAFYNTAYPNLVFDIKNALPHKQNALRSYTAQFEEKGLDQLISQTTLLATLVAEDEAFEFGESFKVMAPWMLHCFPLAMHC